MPVIPKIIVAGDVSIDWIEVPVGAPDFGSNGIDLLNWQLQPGIRRIAKRGGALLLADLIELATGASVITHHLDDLENQSPEALIHSIVQIGKFPMSSNDKDKDTEVYRVERMRGFSGPTNGVPNSPPLMSNPIAASLVVLDDAGNGYREAKDQWPRALQVGKKKPIVIYKMSRPLAKGSMWDMVVENHSDSLVVVISANDLREDGVNISRRLSWERTAKDFVWQSEHQDLLCGLKKNCHNLIVCFGIDGAILFTRREIDRGKAEERFHLYYDPAVAEDGFKTNCPGDMLGSTAAFVAALTASVAKRGFNGLGEGVRNGIRSSRRLFQLGFVQDETRKKKKAVRKDAPELGYPTRIFHDPDERDPFIAETLVPITLPIQPADSDPWSVLNQLSGLITLEDVAMKFVKNGKHALLRDIPVGNFAKLKTIDRTEIESFRTIRNLMQEYLGNKNPERPLSIAVFGPPGSGKSFGVIQVAQSIDSKQVESLKFNMAQFTLLHDLVGAFHKVRNVTLRGKTPLVFFDEFDSEFQGKLGWLKYFLAPMQDGEFLDGETMHPIGKAIMVFAGGTSNTYQEFHDVQVNEDSTAFVSQTSLKKQARLTEEEYKDAKVPDFISRLRGYVNILGPNSVTDDDYVYVIRRAVILRHMLQDKAERLFERRSSGRIDDAELRIDDGVLRALLKVPEYKHGLRSMEAILDMSLLSERKTFEQAALPPKAQIELHADAEVFSRLMAEDLLTIKPVKDIMAKAIHERYLRDQKEKGRVSHDDPAMRPWEQLPGQLKTSNRRQAEHVIVKLRAIECDFRPSGRRKRSEFRFKPEEIEVLAKMEHDRWVQERILGGWREGLRDVIKKTTPYLVPWEELDDEIRDNDRQAVRGMPYLMAEAGFEIYRL